MLNATVYICLITVVLLGTMAASAKVLRRGGAVVRGQWASSSMPYAKRSLMSSANTDERISAVIGLSIPPPVLSQLVGESTENFAANGAGCLWMKSGGPWCHVGEMSRSQSLDVLYTCASVEGTVMDKNRPILERALMHRLNIWVFGNTSAFRGRSPSKGNERLPGRSTFDGASLRSSELI